MQFELSYPDSRYDGQLHIYTRVELPFGLGLQVKFYSSSRVGTDYEIFDEHNKSMGRRTFTCSFGPVLNALNKILVEEINILLEEYNLAIDEQEFAQITKKAIDFCEGKYGNHSIDNGDCILWVSWAMNNMNS